MRAHTSSHPHRYDADSHSVTSYLDPGWRWNRGTTTSLRSSPIEPRGRPPTTFENFVSPPPEDLAADAAGDVVESTSLRYRTTAAAYGSQASYVPTPKPLSPPPLLSGQIRSSSYAADGKDSGSRWDGSRYATCDARRSSLGYTSPLTAPPTPTAAAAGPSAAGALGRRGSTAVEDVARHRSLSRFAERSGALRTTAPLPLRLSGAAGAGAPRRTKPTDSTGPLPVASATPPPPSSYLIPPPQPQDVGKLVVVLDLDETLVYSRDTTLYERPGVSQLLKTLKGKCELIVWTAGTREYALDVIRVIDTVCAVQHCIYRHPMWWSGDAGCTKDLRMLGRPMDRVILVDNTPSVFSANPRNSLLVSDFIVPFPRSYNAQEKVLPTLTDIFDHVFRRFTQPCLTDVLASRRITRQNVYLERGDAIELNVLAVRRTVETGWATSARIFRSRYTT
ncbi:hypothetical protein ABB37_04836 [Leptomonas pyrrhocoris]|uniref:Mitochondrial import inner membrane translocase subunit TIM50 n=1 Tax=Leptomonas pyrrhocoris TaxID=157538 RepID=A0A0M9G262_LEPPY|nr:hypothetical protein ABB37_04836 [Leptomonas pyrrhocoris]KPA80649.1 hypothetical protein ABB37_04836 [Leptomonas pyrrhocoris]|eukprot:XP_015659088.1 hypothetical protein ABB37_04836 [Leptomonas pyrrhocoris]